MGSAPLLRDDSDQRRVGAVDGDEQPTAFGIGHEQPRPVDRRESPGGVEVLVEQLHAAGDEEHDADAERERTGKPEYPPFLSIQQQE